MDFRNSPASATSLPVKNDLPSEAVLRAVADADDVAPTELPPLYRAVDPDALDAVFRNRPAGTITFDYNGYTVTISDHVDVSVQE